jgi:glycosyl transferase family 25
LILEDDALLSSKLGTVLPDFCQFLETAAPMVLLLTALRRYRRRPRRKVSGGLYLVKVDSAWRGHGYLVNRPAAERIATLQSPVTCLADDWRALSAMAGLQLWGLNHYMIGLSVFSRESSLDEGRQEAGSNGRSAKGERGVTSGMTGLKDRCFRAIGFVRRQAHPW